MSVQTRRRKRLRKISNEMSTKLAILFLIVLLAFGGLLGYITWLNFTKGRTYRQTVLTQAQQQYGSTTVPAKRGNIYDKNGNLLATSNKVYTIILDCKEVNSAGNREQGIKSAYVEPTIRALVEVFGLDEEDIRKRITSDETWESQYQILKKLVPMEEKKAFDEYKKLITKTDGKLTAEEKAYNEERSNIRGVWFEEGYLRSYPYGETACDTIGFAYASGTADCGLESYYNSLLAGSEGRKYGYISSETDVEQTIIPATAGNNIVTTIDLGIQQIVERYVNAFNEAMGALHVGVIIEDPSTGEILAMDGGDRYDLNDPTGFLYEDYTEEQLKEMTDAEQSTALYSKWSNFCVTDAYEPGSVVKPIVVASALENGSIELSDVFECDGFQNFGAEGSITTIKCAVYPDAHGSETLADVIANSCNDAMMQIGAKMGKEDFAQSQRIFNFGSRTGIDLPNEGSGMIFDVDGLQSTELACSAFGQGFTLTMIQEINAMCAAVNGGYYYQPHLVSKITDNNGGVVKNISPVLMRQTISAEISANVRTYMQASVERGTSRTSKVQGYSSGGKTGTAEKIPRNEKRYLVSFIGFAPVNDPQIVIYVVVDEPNVEDQATSVYPQYIAQGILSEVLPYLNIAPDETSDGYVEETELWEGFKGHLANKFDGKMDDNGNLVNSEGKLIDWDGNLIDEDGYLMKEDGTYQTDKKGKRILSENLEGVKMTGSSTVDLPEATSNPDMPEPPEGDSEELLQNNMESEGITNEEAGLQ